MQKTKLAVSQLVDYVNGKELNSLDLLHAQVATGCPFILTRLEEKLLG